MNDVADNLIIKLSTISSRSPNSLSIEKEIFRWALECKYTFKYYYAQES